MNRRLVAKALACAVLFATLESCGSSDEASTFGQYDEQRAQGVARVVHVHGLGINPKDGSLYAATHNGLFLIQMDGTAERVGESYQDTMGFTIVGPDRFLGSGHPDQRDYQDGWPGLPGLILSEDGGRVWKEVSLKGEADFHVLKIAHGRIYGFDSTGEAFMVSRNEGRSWETRSKLTLSDFAVDPSRAEVVIASAGPTLLKSSDEGKTWRRGQAPGLVLLSWPAAARLWGLDAMGTVYLSGDGGGSWQAQGLLPGRPEAFLDAANALYAAVHEAGIFRSTDLGRTWQVIYQDPLR